jgi:hypothetical protein
MKTLTTFGLLLAVIVMPKGIYAQLLNPDFEQWDSSSLSKPNAYRVYGQTNQVLGYNSPFAVRVQRNSQLSDGPGAVLYGNPENGFTGGIPFQARPDSAVAFFKYHIVPGDTAWFLVFLKQNGQFISQDVFKLAGSDSTAFHRLSYKINYQGLGSADSMIVGVASTNPDLNFQGSFVIVDSIHFVSGALAFQIPNGNFEQWQTIVYPRLTGWMSTNPQAIDQANMPVTRSNDHITGQYACKIQNVLVGNNQYLNGYIMLGKQGNNGPLPGFKVNGKDSLLYVSYKCFPQGDTINIAILMFKNGNLIGMGNFRQMYTISSWSQAVVPISYWQNNIIPDSAAIFCSAFQGGGQVHGATVLYVDAMSLNAPPSSISSQWVLPVKAYPNPCKNSIQIDCPKSITQVKQVQVNNVLGQVYTLPFVLSNGQLLIDTQDLPMGNYWYKVLSIGPTLSGSFTVKD